jgi:hypothetical protein
MARKEGQAALVVSSDQDIVQSAAASGAATVSANDFENKLTMSMDMDALQIDRDNYEGWQPTTKKKGPSRRMRTQQANVQAAAQKQRENS